MYSLCKIFNMSPVWVRLLSAYIIVYIWCMYCVFTSAIENLSSSSAGSGIGSRTGAALDRITASWLSMLSVFPITHRNLPPPHTHTHTHWTHPPTTAHTHTHTHTLSRHTAAGTCGRPSHCDHRQALEMMKACLSLSSCLPLSLLSFSCQTVKIVSFTSRLSVSLSLCVSVSLCLNSLPPLPPPPPLLLPLLQGIQMKRWCCVVVCLCLYEVCVCVVCERVSQISRLILPLSSPTWRKKERVGLPPLCLSLSISLAQLQSLSSSLYPPSFLSLFASSDNEPSAATGSAHQHTHTETDRG